MSILPDLLENYISKHSEAEPLLLNELAQETKETIPQPVMLSAHYQGRLLSIISRLMCPKVILEVGTYTGYSAICLAEGLQKEGILHTIDPDESLINIQSRYFDKAGLRSQIIQHTAHALDVIPALELTFDLAFIDADKANYVNYYNLIIDKMRSGGCIISDNILWKGKVYEDYKPDKRTQNMLAYNNKLHQDPRVNSLILPVRDGLSICFVK